MTMFLDIFLLCAQLCAFAFGGGYVMIPSLLRASESHGWATSAQLTDVVAIAGMSPGPVALNAAVGFGFRVGGFTGATAAFLGIVIPCGLIVLVVAGLFMKSYHHPAVQACLTGLRPVITGIIVYAALNLAQKNGILWPAGSKHVSHGLMLAAGGFTFLELKSIIIAISAFVLLSRTKIPPAALIVASGIAGVLIF